jgi:hypothetical protein
MSRELDAEVAQKAMGYAYDGVAWWTHSSGQRTSVDGLPRFSTDIAAAWRVVERITDPDGPFGAQKWSFGMEYSSVIGWVVDFTPRTRHPKAREYPAFQAQATTAPEAICRAALKAVETH